MEIPQIKELINLFEKSSLSELDFSSQEYSLKLKRPTASVEPTVQQADSSPLPSQNTAHSPSGNQQHPSTENTGIITISAPLVGIFYLTPAPDADPYVREGSIISQGATLCAIEAMKLFNELTADYDCEVVSICAPQGSLVEFGQPLFKVRRV